MRNITFSADEHVIESARDRATREHTTLNDEFRRWLKEYASCGSRGAEAMRIVDDILRYTGTGGRKFTREEMNER